MSSLLELGILGVATLMTVWMGLTWGAHPAIAVGLAALVLAVVLGRGDR